MSCIAARHIPKDGVVPRLQRDVQMPTDRGSLEQRRDELVVYVVDLDGRKPEPCEPGCRARLAHETCEPVTGSAVAVAPQVDSRQDNLAVPLLDAVADFAQNGSRVAASRRAPNEWDDAEVAGEAAAVLDLHERADAIEPRVGLDASNRADVPGDRVGRVFPPPGDDGDIVRKSGECVTGEVGTAPRDVDARMRACGPSRRMA